ncbi:KUP/HAK/KT family potassium transporter [Macrococcus carouselicus]|uniref:Probable potassium transport system protein Kup n=1 Tax=Macrococcus carouselicus TaxID=69969 RepID=A0A9Q8FQQ6_9STAP|nr:KUP/HAK/KT family potassium transporter [Macrococcus carouselicus]TDM03983.1 potassium transporter Kup [Macrococcus carouselicus]
MKTESKSNRFKLAMMLIAIGIVYGDIGTSPLYVMKAVVETNGGMEAISETYIIGCLSLIIWTITLLTTVKYVLIAMRADNHGEGGIFSLYTLVRKRRSWLLVPAIIGGAALLADGILTPAVTVTSAIEGIQEIPGLKESFLAQQNYILLIVITIISLIFFAQRFGTGSIGKIFGPFMMIWFSMLGIFGLMNLVTDVSVLRAFNPLYGIEILFDDSNKAGLMILGTVFLSTTGAEALYSDMGHVGKGAIYKTWPFVKVMLLLNYFGQCAWLIGRIRNRDFVPGEPINPFFQIMPDSFVVVGVIIATGAAIIASQALISGSYTLVSEAIHLRLMPKVDIKYPSTVKGQMYIPSVTFLIWLLCIFVVLYFRTSVNMEAAYGLSITVTMMMSTILLWHYLISRKHSAVLVTLVIGFFLLLEAAFFISSLAKFMHGGYIAVIISLAIALLMVIWYKGYQIKDRRAYDINIDLYKNQLRELSQDKRFPKYATNLVYLSTTSDMRMAEKQIFKSILDGRPKRADVYWLVNVRVSDQPFQVNYQIEDFGTDNVFKVQLVLGFRIHQNVNLYIKQIAETMLQKGCIAEQKRTYGTNPAMKVADFTYIILQDELPIDAKIAWRDRLIVEAKIFIKRFTASPIRWFELPSNEVHYEVIPISMPTYKTPPIKQIRHMKK